MPEPTSEIQIAEQTRHTEGSSLEAWQMTDPKKHDPYSFRYIVHSLPDDDDLDYSLAMEHYRFGQEEGLGSEAPIWPLTEPERFLKKNYISCSVIDSGHKNTKDSSGLILHVPPQNIIDAHSSDMGSSYNDKIQRYREGENIPDASEVLKRTAPGSYNEVLIRGISKKGTKIQFVGVFFSGVENLTPENREKQLRAFAKKHKLPIIEF